MWGVHKLQKLRKNKSDTNCLHNEDIMIVVEMMHLGFNKQV